jgi:hypothetical protein
VCAGDPQLSHMARSGGAMPCGTRLISGRGHGVILGFPHCARGGTGFSTDLTETFPDLTNFSSDLTGTFPDLTGTSSEPNPAPGTEPQPTGLTPPHPPSGARIISNPLSVFTRTKPPARPRHRGRAIPAARTPLQVSPWLADRLAARKSNSRVTSQINPRGDPPCRSMTTSRIPTTASARGP